VIIGARYDEQSGHLVVEVRAARTGTQEYVTGPEHRDASEVFAPTSLASWVGAPVTVGHRAWALMSNVRSIAIGYVRAVERDRADGQPYEYVRAELVITNASAISDIRSGRLVEASAGYNCKVVDGRQVGIEVNHLALGPRGWARCGTSCEITSRP
jgi:hypothetical protein